MTTPVAYGIDFGTTNSSIAVAYSHDAELIDVDRESGPVMPSMVYIDDTGNELAGNDAVRQFLVAAGAPNVRLMSSLKTFLSEPTLTHTTSLWGATHTIEELVAIVLRHLKRAADAQVGADVRRLFLGHPVLFVGAEGADAGERQELALGRLEQAAALAGFEEVAFVDEPTAALSAEVAEGRLMAIDFGGGTFDVSVVELTRETGEVLSIHGAGVGGELFDSLLFDAKLAGPLGLDREYRRDGQWLPVPGSIRAMRTLAGILGMVNDGRARIALRSMYGCEEGERLRVIEEILDGGHSYNFYRSVEATKIELSDVEASAFYFDRAGVNIDVPVTRKELTAAIGENLEQCISRVQLALDDARLRPQDIDLVVRTGGSSRIPAFVGMLADLFGADKIEERDTFGSVATGLALCAADEWGDHR